MKAPMLLVDTSNLAFRSFWACKNLKHEGQHTGLYHGFLMAVRSLQKLPHREIVFCWDYGTPAQDGEREYVEPWRRRLYPPYKSNRVKSPEAALVLTQFWELQQVLQALGYANVGIPGLEADDIIGLLSARPGNWLLYSHDDDLFQLLETGRVEVLHRKKKWETITQAMIEKQYSFPVSRFAAYLALGGDKSDNIHSLPRCGAVGAAHLVQAGANPLLAYDEQPQCAQIARFAGPWQEGLVKRAYQVAHIPRIATDPRIRELTRNFPLPKWLERDVSNQADRIEKFTQFCAQRGLGECILQRYKFFEANPNGKEAKARTRMFGN